MANVSLNNSGVTTPVINMGENTLSYDGENLIWNGKTFENILFDKNDFLSSAGGEIRGSLINTNSSQAVIENKSYDENENVVNGASLHLFPSNDTNYKGGFALRAPTDEGTYVELCGKNDGTLSWNNTKLLTTIGGNVNSLTIANNAVLTSQNVSIGYLDYANAISLSISSNDTTSLSYTAPSNGMFYLVGKADDRASISIGKFSLEIGDTGYTRPSAACVPLKKGDVITYITTNKAYFVKSKY